MKILIVFAVFSVTGWLMLFIGISMRRDWHRRLDREHTRATATVVNLVTKDRQGDASTDAFPVVEFMADGQLVRKQYDYAMPRDKYPVGQQLDILYDIADPTRFHFDTANDPGKGRKPIRFGLIWIVASLLVTLLLYGLVTGEISDWGRDFSVDRVLRSLRRPKASTTKPDTKAEAEGFKYSLQTDGSATLEQYVGSMDAVTIPLIVDGHIVTKLSPAVLSGARTVKRLTVPGTIRSIPAGAFTGGLSLTDVNLLDGVADIGSMAFAMCPSLKDVTIPESVERIASDAFPEDCAAVFHVAEGSAAQRYCEEMDFACETTAK